MGGIRTFSLVVLVVGAAALAGSLIWADSLALAVVGSVLLVCGLAPLAFGMLVRASTRLLEPASRLDGRGYTETSGIRWR